MLYAQHICLFVIVHVHADNIYMCLLFRFLTDQLMKVQIVNDVNKVIDTFHHFMSGLLSY